MHAIVTVSGKDKTGIIARVSAFLAERGVNILDISQTIMHGHFAMVMLADLSEAKVQLSSLSEQSTALGEEIGMSIHVQHEEIFNAMHKV